VFCAYDSNHPWRELVEAAYDTLQRASAENATGLPPDWVYLHLDTGRLTPGDADERAFGYDALRVFWRVQLDRQWFDAPEAQKYLERATRWPIRERQSHQRLPAVIGADGSARATYESLDMLATLMPALKATAPQVALEMNDRLQSRYSKGFWGEPDRYYLQNWAWFGTVLYADDLGPLKMLRACGVSK
jgi:endoglucanase